MENMERLLTDMKESLEREVRALRDSMNEGFAQVTTRFDTLEARLERQGALIQIGSRWTTRMNAWAEKVDSALDKKDREIAELRDRLNRLGRQQ